LRHTDSIIEIKNDQINITTGKSSITMKKGGDIEINGSNVVITGGQLTTKGTANNDTMGPYCALKYCPYSGVPHVGSIVSGT
jgi:predicted GTPase